MSEQFVQGYINQLPKSNRIALDVGANHGIYTKLLADKFAKVYAFEPVQDNILILTKNVKDCPNVEIVPKAISHTTGTTRIHLNGNNPGGHTLSEKVKGHTEWGFGTQAPTIEVPTITLDEFCKDLDVEFIKFDVEGAEEFIFGGAHEVLSRKNINIMLEVHNEVDLDKLYKMFVGFGFRAITLGLSITDKGIRNEAVPANKFIADNHYLLVKG